MSRSVLCALAALATALPLYADHFEFTATGPFETAPFSFNVYAGDFDGDGHADVAVSRGTGLSLLIGDGFGGFAPDQDVELGFAPQSLASGDFDGDTVPDLLLGSPGTTVELFLGDGGDFVFEIAVDVGASFPFAAAADFDGDGNLDFVTTVDAVPPLVSVFAGDGNGGFAAPLELATANSPRRLITDDFNGDGATDVAVCHFDFAANDGGIGIYYGDGQGGFTAEDLVTDGPTVDLRSTDLDADGVRDLVALVPDFGAVCGNIAEFYLGNGGDFTLTQSITGACGPHATVLEDFDLDGFVDLVITDGGDLIAAANEINIYHGVGDGTFEEPTLIETGLYTLAAPVTADYDEDGLVDLAAGLFAEGVTLFVNATTPAAGPFRRGDADGSGAFNGLVDALFVLEFQFGGGPPPGCDDAADVDDDGVLNGLVDALYALNFQFAGGAPPPAPGPLTCGDDPTGDLLGCVESPCP